VAKLTADDRRVAALTRHDTCDRPMRAQRPDD
jgi:hypothetical protein